MRFLLIFLIPLLIIACTKQPVYTVQPFIQMGTVVMITLPENKKALLAELEDFTGSLSDLITGDCESISSHEEEVEISYATYALLKRGEEYTDLSNGVFNPAISSITQMYGFPEGPYHIPSESDVSKELEKIKIRRILLREENGHYYATGNGLTIDLGAYAKGWIVDEASLFLKKKGVSSFIINAGGDLYASGEKSKNTKWRLGITDPDKKQDYVLAVSLQDEALATSGTYERFFIAEDGRRISHIFDAQTGLPAHQYKSLSVIAGNAELADLLSTVYFLLPEEEIQHLCTQQKTPVYLIRSDGSSETLCDWEKYLK